MSASAPASRRRSATAKLARRKRTIIACQFCRLRKTRCDGIKPVCGFCQHHDAQCVWSTGAENAVGCESTPAEREILQRLDDIKALLHSPGRPPPQLAADQGSLDVSPSHDFAPASPATVSSRPSQLLSVCPSAPPYASTRCESILRWPVFHGVIEPSVAAIESFALEANLDSYSSHHAPFSPRARMAGPGVEEHLFVPLCRKFLAHVHPRNPILEGGQLIRYAKRAVENGLDWDGPSCLVLIACALACYTSPWERDAAGPSEWHDSLQDADVAAAEAYYLAAKKRIGLLGYSVTDIQCLFFASIYEKYALRPLQAWFYIQQASSRLQAHLKRQRRVSMLQAQHSEESLKYQLEQRVFWSIFKAENELLPELPFKSSGIEELARSDSMFPLPPTISTEREATEPPSPNELNSWQEERSWFFYLAEISLRRTINDTLWLLYRKGEQYWMTHIDSLEEQYEETERQISLWYSHLPHSIRFDPLDQPDNELAFYLQGRFYEWRHHIQRPFLYHALHRPETHALSPRILSYAQECVFACASGIVYFDRHHRHGGTWSVCRHTFAFALLILAVVAKSDRDLLPPPNWPSSIETAISTLLKWESQSADITFMRSTLQTLFRTISTASGVASVV